MERARNKKSTLFNESRLRRTMAELISANICVCTLPGSSECSVGSSGLLGTLGELLFDEIGGEGAENGRRRGRPASAPGPREGGGRPENSRTAERVDTPDPYLAWVMRCEGRCSSGLDFDSRRRVRDRAHRDAETLSNVRKSPMPPQTRDRLDGATTGSCMVTISASLLPEPFDPAQNPRSLGFAASSWLYTRDAPAHARATILRLIPAT